MLGSSFKPLKEFSISAGTTVYYLQLVEEAGEGGYGKVFLYKTNEEDKKEIAKYGARAARPYDCVVKFYDVPLKTDQTFSTKFLEASLTEPSVQ